MKDLRTKKHFEILDGLRGVAALSVVVFHFMEVIEADYANSFIGNGFLAVDFFFCLSGFVIAYAYDDRMANLGVKGFFKARLIRLHPLVVLGSVLGIAGFYFNPFAPHQALRIVRITKLVLSSILLIPYPAMRERFFNLFSFNAPAWSLFWEYVANVFYALVLYRIRRRYLLLLIILSAIALCLVVYQQGALSGGWDGHTFWVGLVRVAYSFMAGLLVYRSGRIIKNRLGFLPMSILLVLALLFPYSKWNYLSESLIVLLYFPFLIMLGAGATPGPRLAKLCGFFGKISYPLYMTHYWAIWIFFDFYKSHQHRPLETFFIVAAATVVLIILSYIIMIAYDGPVRRFLNRRS